MQYTTVAVTQDISLSYTGFLFQGVETGGTQYRNEET